MSFEAGTKVRITHPTAVDLGYTEGEVVDPSYFEEGYGTTYDREVVERVITDGGVFVKLEPKEVNGLFMSFQEDTPGAFTFPLEANEVEAL
jgi:hypothetical protein